MTTYSPLREKSYKFSAETVLFCKKLIAEKREYVITKQLIKSSTSISANIEEAQQAESRKDFISKLKIAIKEAFESRFWIRLICDTGYAQTQDLEQNKKDLDEVIAMLHASISTLKKNS